jgi:copper(I)-binding protein
MKTVGISIFALFLAAMMPCCAREPLADLQLTGGWVRAPLPNSSATSAYGKFYNQGTAAFEIVAISSDSFARVSLHETRIQQGVSRMESHSTWILQPGDDLELRPGGLHLMLMQPTREIKVGSEITLILADRSGKTFEFRLPVEAR